MLEQNEQLIEQRHLINQAYLTNENDQINDLLEHAEFEYATATKVQACARDLVVKLRESQAEKNTLDAFFYEYDLSSDEGIALMCLAEAMLRVPDSETVDDLIRDKIASANWEERLGKSDSFFVNASTWALMLTGKLVSNQKTGRFASALKGILRESSEPFIRQAVRQAMRILSKQFVKGRTIQEALKQSKAQLNRYSFSYDMLGEVARTAQDAELYYQRYYEAITELAKQAKHQNPLKNPGISIKLSALHPRYDFAKQERVLAELTPRLLALAEQAKKANINLTVDAEEARLLDLSLQIFASVYNDAKLDGWDGFGLALQTYQKRAWYVIDWLVTLSQQQKRRIPVRLIKGAYWDSEIKYAQLEGLDSYPVFTRKHSTDISFIACARKLLQFPDAIYPQFGTHNAYSVAAVLTLTQQAGVTDFEFQCLHGMGQSLYDQVVEQYQVPCRIYAPVGNHKVLLSYLVRRLLENGANTSFVNRLADKKIPVEAIIEDPVVRIKQLESKPHPKIPLPRHIYGQERQNSRGVNLSDYEMLDQAKAELAKHFPQAVHAYSLVEGKAVKTKNSQPIYSPIDKRQIGQADYVTEEQVAKAISVASQSFSEWESKSVEERAQCLLRMADLMEEHLFELVAIMSQEGGKTLVDGINDVREAVDFCRYYAKQARNKLIPHPMPGPTGEFNRLSYYGRGPIVCISPWNFPLAIFIGQVTAALVTGNTVLAKPAEQTPYIAYRAVQLLHQAGVPKGVVQLLLGTGETVGARLVNDEAIKGVMFTGSTATAKAINQTLAQRKGDIIPLIAETGGQNAMIVDSSALLEQAVADVVLSAFGSAGQRCSALRVLYIQEDVADEFIEMLKGAMAELKAGEPSQLSVDLGPVIDQEALEGLQKHFNEMQNADKAKLIYQVPLQAACQQGTFFAPCAFEIDSIEQLKEEHFGPFLHVIRFKLAKLDQVLDAINATGYGLTFGVHTRIDQRAEYICQRLRAGNQYVNRNMTGAVVGVQPFGGQGLSGTGPKAGGPNYLLRLVTERALSVDTTASGGNASLLTLTEED